MSDALYLQSRTGARVHVCPWMTVSVRQHKQPKKHKRTPDKYHQRIQKKWDKRFGKKPDPSILGMPGNVFMHPATLAALVAKHKLERQNG